MTIRAPRSALAIALAVVAALAWLGACSDNASGPDCCSPPPQGLMLSDPVLGAVAARAGAPLALAGGAGDVTYVSLPPGTVPGGSSASIRRVGAIDSVQTQVYEGGFDPVPVAAQVGDSISIRVTDAEGGTLLELRAAVVAARPPVVVRTNPPRDKTDVPVNASIVVVFSEPIDSPTLSGAVQLRRGNTSIAGQLAFRDSAHLTAVFVPAQPLLTNTEYTLTVTQGIRDLDGEALETPFNTRFTTAATVSGYEEYFVDLGGFFTADNVNDSVHARAEVEVFDGAGARIEGAIVRFRGSIGTVAPQITTSGFAGLATVDWSFLGTMGGPGPSAQLSTCASNSTIRCDMYWTILSIGLRTP